MSILKFFKPLPTLPTPEDTGIGPVATQEGNLRVERVLDLQQKTEPARKKRKTYTTFPGKQRTDIGRYAAENGNAAAVEKFRKEIPDLGESTVRLFKQRYLAEVKNSRCGEPILEVSLRKRGRPLALGKELDADVQKFVKALRSAGTAVNGAVVQAVAEGIVTAKNQTLLAANGGCITISKSWAKSLMARMGLVKCHGSTKSNLRLSGEEYDRIRNAYVMGIVTKARSGNIPPQLIINWDQTGLNVVPTSSWTMHEAGSRRVEIMGLTDKRQITATYAAAMSGDVLPIQILYTGKLHDAILATLSQTVLTFGIHQIIGQIVKPPCILFPTS